MSKLKNIQRIPLSLVWTMIMIVSFTFVDYTWITEVVGRLLFIVLTLVGGVLLSAANSDLHFWGKK